MPSPRDWRERVIELRDIASQTDDADQRRKLLELADKWEKVAQDVPILSVRTCLPSFLHDGE